MILIVDSAYDQTCQYLVLFESIAADVHGSRWRVVYLRRSLISIHLSLVRHLPGLDSVNMRSAYERTALRIGKLLQQSRKLT
jgi:hypothetical protein